VKLSAATASAAAQPKSFHLVRKPMARTWAVLSDRALSRANNFDFLRFLAALMVIVSHSFALTGHPEPMVGRFTLGTIGVFIFFSISGFLIAKSWESHPRPSAFLGKRILRIVPGLAGAILFTVFVIGVLFSTVPVRSFVTGQATLQYLNSIFIYSIGSTLPGLFAANPLSGAVNGSLWTLPYEFTAYALAAILGVIGLLKHKHRLLWVLAAVIVLDYLVVGTPTGTDLPLTNLDIHPFFRLLGFFIAGMLLYVWRHRVPINLNLIVGATVLFLIGAQLPGSVAWTTLTLPYVVIAVAYTNWGKVQRFGRYGDFSYGMYIYAFPIQQSVVGLHRGIKPWELIVVGLPIIIGVAALSWHGIEKPALRRKHIFGKEHYPIKGEAAPAVVS
jgi:peptidoglycan/LPS O-acetylase OafA/YrhL